MRIKDLHVSGGGVIKRRVYDALFQENHSNHQQGNL